MSQALTAWAEPGLWDDGGGEMGRLEWDIQNQAK